MHFRVSLREFLKSEALRFTVQNQNTCQKVRRDSSTFLFFHFFIVVTWRAGEEAHAPRAVLPTARGVGRGRQRSVLVQRLAPEGGQGAGGLGPVAGGGGAALARRPAQHVQGPRSQRGARVGREHYGRTAAVGCNRGQPKSPPIPITYYTIHFLENLKKINEFNGIALYFD